MKWPSNLILIRHDKSEYNALREKKMGDLTYQEFLKEFKNNPDSAKTKKLAEKIREIFSLKFGDYNTPLAENEGYQAIITGKKIKKTFKLPDVIFVSPYERTLHTLKNITRGWPELAVVKTYEEERMREQEHGIALLYNDWRVFYALHPDQRHLHKLEGPYWYRYPQGESVPDVRLRIRSMTETLIREFPEKRVLLITHHLTILSIRANLERLNAREFIRIDEEEKPINCGVTHYKGNPRAGKNGKLELIFYNKKFY